jgi:hypothetical protein
VASILINIKLVEQIATAENNKRHLHLLYKEGLCVLLSVVITAVMLSLSHILFLL